MCFAVQRYTVTLRGFDLAMVYYWKRSAPDDITICMVYHSATSGIHHMPCFEHFHARSE